MVRLRLARVGRIALSAAAVLGPESYTAEVVYRLTQLYLAVASHQARAVFGKIRMDGWLLNESVPLPLPRSRRRYRPNLGFITFAHTPLHFSAVHLRGPISRHENAETRLFDDANHGIALASEPPLLVEECQQ